MTSAEGAGPGLKSAAGLRRNPYLLDATRLTWVLRAAFENWLWPSALRLLASRLQNVIPRAGSVLYEQRLVLRTREGPRFRLRLRDLDGPAYVFGSGEYDFEVIDWSRVRTVVDAGAHVGGFTLWAARRANCRILALEPNPETYELLAENVRRAGILSRVTLFNAALAGGSGTRTLHTPPGPSHGDSVAIEKGGGSVEVRAMTLSELLASGGIEHVDLLKLDVEGAEYEVIKEIHLDLLRGAGVIMIECHDVPGQSPALIVDKLRAAGASVASDLEASGMLLAWREPPARR